MNTPTYRGYRARVEYDTKDAIFFGHIGDIDDIVGFHADNPEDLDKAFRDAVDDYIDLLAGLGRTAALNRTRSRPS